MRFGSFVQYRIGSRLFAKRGEILRFAPHIHGGWEVWAQIETATATTGGEERFTFEREEAYSGISGQVCDFVLHFEGADARAIWIELKVQLLSGVYKLFDRFEADRAKIQNAINDGAVFGPNDSGGAVAFAFSHALNLVNYAHTKVTGDARKNYQLFGCRTNQQTYRANLYNVDDQFVSNNDMMLIWTEMIGKTPIP